MCRFAEGASSRAAGHFQFPGLLRAYCGKNLGAPASTDARPCRPCLSLAGRIGTFLHRTGYRLPAVPVATAPATHLAFTGPNEAEAAVTSGLLF
ncbi:hypothetical protein ACWCZ5_03570 [Streptomyces sp. NPDC001667]